MTFDDFWAAWPDKRNKESARKAFAKLKAPDQQKARERAAEWCRQWRKDYPTASHVHASTYLNQKRFLDTEEVSQAQQVDARAVEEMHAAWIREGKDFLCRNISPTRAHVLIASGLVSMDDCRKAGVL